MFIMLTAAAAAAADAAQENAPTTTTTTAPAPSSSSYYDKGSVEIAVETPVMRARLDKRREISTGNAERLLIVLCGLPARGKSFLARKLVNYTTWRGNRCKIFNVGRYRRQATAAADVEVQQHADFFDDENAAAAQIRAMAAELALKDTLAWLEADKDDSDDDDSDNESNSNHRDTAVVKSCASGSLFIGHTSHSSRRQTQRIAIFDATNSTRARRNWILQQCDQASEASGKETGVVFVESICDDKELLQENYNVKISTSPDFEGMSREDALADLQERIRKYEARYEPIDDDTQSYIKIFNLSSKLMVNHVYGRLAKIIVPGLMAWNTGSRPIFLCRAGETESGGLRRPISNTMSHTNLRKLARHQESDLSSHGHVTKRQRGDRLSERGLRFRDALCDFVAAEGMEYMEKSTNVIHPRKFDTGTSMSGLREKHRDDRPLFPCLIMSSTMPRALETAAWTQLPFPIKDVSNLNPLDMGEFAGMDLETIRENDPDWLKELEQEPFHTRYVYPWWQWMDG